MQGQADGRRQEDLALGVGIGVVDGAPDHVGEGEDAIGLALGEQHDGELVAGNAGQRILRLQQPAQATGKRQQDGVAGSVTDRVVDLLELVDIDARGRSGGAYRPGLRTSGPLQAGHRRAARFGRPVRLSCTASCSSRSSASSLRDVGQGADDADDLAIRPDDRPRLQAKPV